MSKKKPLFLDHLNKAHLNKSSAKGDERKKRERKSLKRIRIKTQPMEDSSLLPLGIKTHSFWVLRGDSLTPPPAYTIVFAIIHLVFLRSSPKHGISFEL
jgi:hypothetical protein